jgi:hypothetical protein
MYAEVAVGDPQRVAKLDERQTIGSRERAQDAQTDPLMDQRIEPDGSGGSFGRRSLISSRQSILQVS